MCDPGIPSFDFAAFNRLLTADLIAFWTDFLEPVVGKGDRNRGFGLRIIAPGSRIENILEHIISATSSPGFASCFVFGLAYATITSPLYVYMNQKQKMLKFVTKLSLTSKEECICLLAGLND
ncbi:hypothetical protein F5050DRAFT_1711893 [Lentinula boryana]|uniref:Uncharacterized protein n=1 Tax=Lentinula boryana TaxID=40481 RepID=A0ABQ8QDX8_9AGAR|nr:hypothetical protein F5050DRAFT_1711893 [Lentinula boryana]